MDPRHGHVGSGTWADRTEFWDARIELAAATTAVAANGLGAVMESEAAVVMGMPPAGRQMWGVRRAISGIFLLERRTLC